VEVKTCTFLAETLKVFFGILNDCLPIKGYHRKPYMVMGWLCCAACMIVLATRTLPAAYNCSGEKEGGARDVCTEDYRRQVSAQVSEYTVLFVLASIGCTLTHMAADGLMVEYARREPEEARGATQSQALIARGVGTVLANTLVPYSFNGSNGTAHSFKAICLTFAVLSALMVPVSWYLVVEPRVRQVVTFRE
jgi:MFS family permease